MNTRKNYSFNKISFTQEGQSNAYELISNNEYSNDKGYGIIKSEYYGNILSATLMNRVSTYVSEYDSVNKTIGKRQIFLYAETDFFLDFNKELIYSAGSAKSLNHVKSFLRNTLSKNYSISNIDLNPFQLYKQLGEKKIKFKIDEVYFEKFNYKGGAIGRFAAKIYDMNIADELIENFKSELSKIVFKLNSEEDEFKVYYSNKNTIGISSKEDNLEDNFQYLKELIF